MPPTERFDIYDKHRNPIGTDTRENVHARGLWHQTFHCWVLNQVVGEKGSLLFQLRHKDKDTFPGKLDTSCAGHLQAGETVKDGVRELKEELGLDIPFEQLEYCGTCTEESRPSPGIIDNEFSSVFLYVSSQPLEAYDFQREEISGLFFVDVLAFQKLVAGELESLRIRGVIADENTGEIVEDERLAAIDSFTPNTEEYYRLLFSRL
ncbi:hypothetical protein PSTEL_16660 [Paenibacillus stellifer]|uniref:Nudix hydrolase domain-containing protein n=1 Tax=Paenibacillus stellifer TaxID=169760 RepID=A0A089LSI7_9BACL|nr:NUDIX domain-containing protein [Paenibacillus stellifer]AIQ64491.1 hypothetical protein PSTEL_16660 [Paenibacillus stellifer]